MWSEISFDDTQLLERGMLIMKLMSQTFQNWTLAQRIRPWMRLAHGHVYRYLQGDVEIVLGIAVDPKKALTRIYALGFIGGQPQAVLTLVLDKLRTLLPQNGVQECFASFPQTWDFAPMAQLVSQVPAQPGVSVQVELASQDQLIWKISLAPQA